VSLGEGQYRRSMRLLLSSVAHDRYWSRLARDGVDPLIMSMDGGLLSADGTEVDRDSASPEIAWGTSDLFFDGHPLRAFFAMLRHSASLRWFQSVAAGYDGPIFAELANRGVRVCNSHANSIPIAEYVMRSVLDGFQRSDRWREGQSSRLWRTHDFREVCGSTWLVIGLGGIGREVSIRARAFGGTVIGCRRNPSGHDPVDTVITPADLHRFVGSADVVVVAAPATAETSGLIDSAFLAMMKPESLLVNVARGSLVDETALVAALDRGVPALAFLDVFAAEPLPEDNPLWAHPSVVVTPHNAALGLGRYARQTDLFVANLDRYLEGRDLINEVTEAARQG
jgi:glyoxylate/hydroxypyruvate reductase